MTPHVKRSRFERRRAEDPLRRRDQTVAYAEDWRPPDWFTNIVVVLVETTDPVNVGGVVRAMANTGFRRLRLVNPVGFDPWHVIGIAHYTQYILNATEVFDSLAAAVADAHLVIGLTGKHHRVERNAVSLHAGMAEVAEFAQAGQRVALVFGREDLGLTNTQLDLCHGVTTIPTNPAHPSLNLAQAALLVLYDIFERAGGGQQSFRPARRAAPPASSALLEDLFVDLERALDAIEFLKSRSRVSIMRSLRVALLRARLNQREASLLRAIAIEIRHYLHRRGILPTVGPVGAPADLTRGNDSGMLPAGPPEAATDTLQLPSSR
jgi:TrmH family RNA methyltransferase